MAFANFKPPKDPDVKTHYWSKIVSMFFFSLWLNSKTGVSIGFEMRLPCFLLSVVSLLILFLLVWFTRWFYESIIQKWPGLLNLLRDNNRFAMNSFGRFLEVIIFLAIIIFLARLILIIFTVNREAFFSDNIASTDLQKLFIQITEILKNIGLIFLFGIISLILRWLSSKGKGTVVVPFVDLNTGDEKKGKAIASSLVAELNRIRHIQTLIKPSPKSDEHIKLQFANIPAIIPIQENIDSAPSAKCAFSMKETVNVLATIKS